MISVDHAHLDLVQTAARLYNLDPALVCAVCEQESGWDPWAIRYEAKFFEHYVQPLLTNGSIKTFTEGRARAFSWGLMQVMGEVAREVGFSGKWLSQLCDPAIGIDLGCKVLRHKIDSNDGDIYSGLESYNGGGNPKYADEVLARVSKYKETP